MRSRSNGGVIGAYALPNQNRANGVFFIHDAAIFNTGANPIWPLASGFIYSATGGTISTAVDNANYKLHTFTANGTFTVTTGAAYIDIFLVGGGGSGGHAYNASTSFIAVGGGGAGGVVLLAQDVWVSSGTTFTVEVGTGGSMLSGALPDTTIAKPSKVTSVSGYSYVAAGGGYGGSRRATTLYSPTAGGGSYNISNSISTVLGGDAPTAGTGSPGTIMSNTFAGGSATGSGTSKWLGGGGSGATTPGYNNDYSFNAALAGNGGEGYYYSRTGYYYGGGGGAGACGVGWGSDANNSAIGRGGLVYNGNRGYGAGGKVYVNNNVSGGTDNINGFGGGGGGSAQYNTTSIISPGAGGSGTVIFCYRYK